MSRVHICEYFTSFLIVLKMKIHAFLIFEGFKKIFFLK